MLDMKLEKKFKCNQNPRKRNRNKEKSMELHAKEHTWVVLSCDCALCSM
jgi:hypothetical protein